MSGLVQIRQGYRATWNDLTFLVESGDRQWTLRVQDAGNGVVYSAGRCNRDAAQAAGLEFALFRCGVSDHRVSPEALARALSWQEYW